MFFKQSGYKPRSLSTSSQGSSGGGVAGSPPKDDSKAAASKTATSSAGATASSPTSPMSGSGAGRRRSSAGSDKFGALEALKRGSQDGDQRKASWADQKPGQSGILGGMWNSFTKGT